MRNAIYAMMLLTCCLGMCLPLGAEGIDREEMGAKVDQGSQIIPEERFRKLLTEFLCLRLEKNASDIAISRFKVIGNRPVPQGALDFEIFQKGTTGLAGYVRAVALVSVDGVTRAKVRLSCWVDIFDPVVCTTRNLKKGEIIEKDDLYLARKNISHLSPRVLTDMGKVMGLMMKHNVREGACLKEWMLERAPIVEKGDMVTILAESDELRLTVPGMVLEKGYLGERVRIQNVMTKKEIYARIINTSTAVVDF
jgi:flagella basal body P-ring formation protein FlgA